MPNISGAAIPRACADLVRREEQLRLTAYPDPATGGAPWTVGYGHTGPDVQPGMTISEARAEELLAADLAAAAAIVDSAVMVPLTEAQRAALISFVFNVGPGGKAKDGFVRLRNGNPSTMLAKLNTGDLAGAGAEFGKWTRGAGKIMPGLVRRRAAEAALFMSDSTDPTPRAVEMAPAMKPMAQSLAVHSGAGGLGLAGVAVALDQARDVSESLRAVLDALPSGGLGWIVAGVLAVSVAAMLYRRWDDQRKVA